MLIESTYCIANVCVYVVLDFQLSRGNMALASSIVTYNVFEGKSQPAPGAKVG